MAILLGAAVLLSDATKTVTEDHDDTPDAAALAPGDLHVMRSRRHPLDYREYLLEAIALMHADDKRAIDVLNHALQLHPTHSGLHLLAGEVLREHGNLDQAAIEYASALRSSSNPERLIAGIVQRLPTAKLIAAAIPPDDTRLREIVRIEELHRLDVAHEWLMRVLAVSTDAQRTCAALFDLDARTHDTSALTTTKCESYQPTKEVKRALAKVALSKHDDATVIHLLADVERWSGGVSDKADAWLTLCQAYAERTDYDEAERCLHRLDATGYVSRELIGHRLDTVRSAREPRVPAGSAQPPPVPASR